LIADNIDRVMTLSLLCCINI